WLRPPGAGSQATAARPTGPPAERHAGRGHLARPQAPACERLAAAQPRRGAGSLAAVAFPEHGHEGLEAEPLRAHGPGPAAGPRVEAHTRLEAGMGRWHQPEVPSHGGER
ncbi:unnamed protein product, partial [Prorocentrum cordatum]